MGAGYRRSAGRAGTALFAGLLLGVSWPSMAQDVDEELEPVSRAVVQPLPNQGAAQLSAALTRLAANPSDIAALLDAGNAALLLGDSEAALGFYGRADQLAPSDPRVKSALARALVLNEDPFAALPLFQSAERAGGSDPKMAGDRGLAYDLVGDNYEAQRFYRQALAAAPQDEEIARRLAISLAIAGDRKASEAALLGQLRSNLPAAWRTRAFAVAILGDTEEAVRIAQGTMPSDLAQAIIPYLRYMPRLTPAQQAAAANFGHFPRAAQIGRDDPRVVQYASLNPRRSVAPAAAAATPDARTQRGRESRSERRSRRRQDGAGPAVAANTATGQKPASARASVPAPVPAPTPSSPPRAAPAPVRVAAATPNPNLTARPVASAQNPGPSVRPDASAARAEPVGPAFAALSTRPPASASPQTATPAPSPAPAPAPAPRSSPAAGPSAPPASAVAGAGVPAAPVSLPPSNLDLAHQAQQSYSAPPAPVASPTPVQSAGEPRTSPPPAPASPAPRRDLASAFGDFVPPDAERAAAPTVDLAAIERERARRAAAAQVEERGPLPDAPKGTRRVASAEPAVSTASGKAPGKPGRDALKAEKDKKDKAAKPEAPKHPSRIWVQIGVGRDKSALAADWRKYQRTEADLFKGKKAWTTPWGQTNRLLVGPFDTQAAAQAFLKEARKQKLDGFVWTSPAGQAVDALAAK